MDDSARPLEPADLLAEAGWLRALARRLTADPDEAAELSQDALCAALARPPAARPEPGSARPWLQAVMSNLWRRRRRDGGARAYHEARAARPEAVEDAEGETLARLELQKRVVEAVRALREPYRTAVTLRHLDGLDYAEVAERTGTSEVAARKRVSRGLDELRARLDRRYGSRSAWGALAFALGRDLPVPSEAAIAAIAGTGGAATLFAGGATMTAGAKIGITVAATGVLIASGVWWGGRDEEPRSLHARGVSPAGQAALVHDDEDTAVRDEGDLDLRDAVVVTAPEPQALVEVATEPGITGRVVDAEGMPVTDARVELLRYVGKDYETLDLAFGREATRLDEARVDADGRFALACEADRRYSVRATAAGLASGEVWAFAGEDVELALAPGGAVFGQVVRPDGLPAIGAELVLRPGKRVGAERLTAETSPDGTFRFDGVAEGEYILDVTSDAGATPSSRSVAVSADREEQVLIQLERGWELTGRVTHAVTGAPIAGVQVAESWVFRKWTTTDANGEFVYADYPREGYIELELRAEGFSPTSIEVRDIFSAGPSATRFEVELVPASTLAGRVLDAEGAPIEGAYVAAAASEMRPPAYQRTCWRAARTDEDGRYRITDVASDMRIGLFVQREGYGTKTLELGMLGPGAHPVTDVVLAPGAVVSGRVVDADGAARVGQRVLLYGANDDRYAALGAEENAGIDSYVAERSTTTDGRGRFAFADVAPGDYRIEASLPGVREGSEVEVKVASKDRGREVEAGELVLSSGLAIRGHVFGPEGTGLGAVLVNAWGGDAGQGGTVLTEADGSFELAGLGPGSYELEIIPTRDVGDQPLARGRERNVAAGTSGLVVRLGEAAVLTGRVVTADGEPAVGATVKLILDGVTTAWEQTDLTGRFEFAPPAGVLVALSAHPPLPEADPSRPFQHDEDPARAVRIEEVDPAAGEVTLLLPGG